jgi:hypothetical protein
MAGMKIAQVCLQLGLSPATLQAWRKKGKGPAWMRDSKGHVWYDGTSVASWQNYKGDPYAETSNNTVTVTAPHTNVAMNPKPEPVPDPVRPANVPSDAEWSTKFTVWTLGDAEWEQDGTAFNHQAKEHNTAKATPQATPSETTRTSKRHANIPADAVWDTHAQEPVRPPNVSPQAVWDAKNKRWRWQQCEWTDIGVSLNDAADGYESIKKPPLKHSNVPAEAIWDIDCFLWTFGNEMWYEDGTKVEATSMTAA